MSTESVLITTTIDKYENQDAAIVDVPGALLTVDIYEEVTLVLGGEFANIKEAISPIIYREYVSVGKNVRNILYVQLQKSLYGCLIRTLIFYRKAKGRD